MIEAPLILGAELLRGGVPMDGLHRFHSGALSIIIAII